MRVDTLLLVDDPSSTQRLWVGPAPTDIALAEADLAHLGDIRPIEVRADAALLRALVGTGGDVIVVASTADDDGRDAGDDSLAGGVGALLRYADASTRHR